MKDFHLSPNEYDILFQTRVPITIWVVLGAFLILSGILICFYSKDKLKYFAYCCLFCYVAIILCNTLCFRKGVTSKVEMIPFWSYIEIWKTGRSFFLWENILNVLLFVPVGILCTMSVRKHRFAKTITFGFLLSLSIEICQLSFKKGWFEFDDIFHNTFGCVIGWLFVTLLWSILRRINTINEKYYHN